MKKNEASKNKMEDREKIHKELLAEINAALRKGDQTFIADVCKCTSDYVGMVLRNERKSQRVIDVAVDLIVNREEFFLKHKKD